MSQLTNVTYEQKARFQLSKELVLQKNHHRSTAIREKEYHWILKSITFVLSHAQPASLRQQYDEGFAAVERLVKEAEIMAHQIKEHQIRIGNERYLSILDQQLPAFFERYDPAFHATYCKEDLDYPLLDGLPLEHAMYHKQGIDLVQEYLRRFALEETFLHHFPDLLTFLSQYELHQGVSIEELGVNLCEIVLTQALFVGMLSMDTLLLTQQQAVFLMEKLMALQDVAGFVTALFERFLTAFPSALASYLSGFQSIFTLRLSLAIESNTLHHLIVTPQKAREERIQLQKECDSSIFQELLTSLHKATTSQGAVDLVLQTPLGFHDYLDLFEMELLSQEELQLLFASLPEAALAILFLEQYQSQYSFHEEIDFQKLQLLDTSMVWERIFLAYLGEMDNERANSVLQHLR